MKTLLNKNNELTKKAVQWKKEQAIISLTIEEMKKTAKKYKVIAENKIDGQTALLEYKSDTAKFGTLGGRVIEDIPVLHEIEKTLKDKRIKQTIMVGELAAYKNGKILPFNESESIIKNSKSNKNLISWHPYQIIELNGEKYDTTNFNVYIKTWPELKKIFNNTKQVFPVGDYIGGSEVIEKAWNKFVLKEKNEGIVVRLSNNRVYKAKPVYHYDLAVIAVGSKKGKNWPKKMVGMCLMAFMDNNHIFRTAGHVASGINDKESKELFAWAQKNKVDEDDVYIWVRPHKIMEIQWERTSIKEMPAYKYSKGKYEPAGKMISGTIVKPRFIRWRPDKSINPNDLRLTQVPGWSEKKKMAMRVASLFLTASDSCEDCKKKSHIKKDREDFYMLNNSTWARLAKKDENLCWKCMVKRFKSTFKRDLKPSDFSEVMYSYNLGNPEVIKITGVHKAYLILAQHRGNKFYGTVTETKSNHEVEKKEDEAPTEKEVIEIRNKWADDMKKKYPDSMVHIEGPEVLKKMAMRIASNFMNCQI
jgi:hypothetical protein